MKRTISVQDMYVGMAKMGVSARMIIKTLNHVKDNPGEWADVKAELLKRCERGDGHISGMGYIDEVRKERAANNQPGFFLNNNWSPYYCRMFAVLYPEYADKFEFRKLKEAA